MEDVVDVADAGVEDVEDGAGDGIEELPWRDAPEVEAEDVAWERPKGAPCTWPLSDQVTALKLKLDSGTLEGDNERKAKELFWELSAQLPTQQEQDKRSRETLRQLEEDDLSEEETATRQTTFWEEGQPTTSELAQIAAGVSEEAAPEIDAVPGRLLARLRARRDKAAGERRAEAPENLPLTGPGAVERAQNAIDAYTGGDLGSQKAPSSAEVTTPR